MKRNGTLATSWRTKWRWINKPEAARAKTLDNQWESSFLCSIRTTRARSNVAHSMRKKNIIYFSIKRNDCKHFLFVYLVFDWNWQPTLDSAHYLRSSGRNMFQASRWHQNCTNSFWTHGHLSFDRIAIICSAGGDLLKLITLSWNTVRSGIIASLSCHLESFEN